MSKAWEMLHPFITQERQERLLQVASFRSKHIRLVLENIRDPHNVSACLRSADAFGLLNIDVISADGFKTSTVAKGAENWLKVTKYLDTGSCIRNLKEQGYKIATAYPPHQQGVIELQELPIDQPVALVFGNEHAGVSSAWEEAIDYKFTIPMYGMVESLNISVSAAITMQQLRNKVIAQQETFLDEGEKTQLLNQWIIKQFKDPELMLKKLQGNEQLKEKT